MSLLTPEGVTYGLVVGRWVQIIGDTSVDPDKLPDTIPVKGSILFTRKQKTTARLDTTQTDGTYVGIAKQNVTGYLRTVDGELARAADSEDTGLWLVTGIYTVTFNLSGTTWPSFDIEVTAAHTAEAPLDLISASPYVAPVGATPVVIMVPAGVPDGYLLAKNGTSFTGIDPATLAVREYSDLSDVDTTGLADGDAMVWDQASGKWVRVSLSAVRAEAAAGLAPAHAPRHRNATWVTTFQSGHGFTATNGTLADDATRPFLGTQSVRMTIPTPSTVGRISRTAMTAMDWTGKHLVIWLQFDSIADMALVGAIELLYGSGSFANYFRRLAWSASSAEKPATGGSWVPVLFVADSNSTTVGTPSLSNITDVRIAVTTTSTAVSGLSFNVGGIELLNEPADVFPNGAICFAFDDGYIDHYTTVAPILDRYGYGATLYTIAEWVDDPNPAFLSMEQLRELQDRHGWEIAGHAYTDAAHTNRLTSLTGEALDAELRNLKSWLRSNGFRGEAYAYPGGRWNDECAAAVARYFSTGRTVSEQGRHNTLPPLNPMVLPCRYSGNFTTTLATQITQAVVNKTLLIVVAHRVGDGKTLSTADFASAVANAAASGAEVLTVTEAIRRANNSTVA